MQEYMRLDIWDDPTSPQRLAKLYALQSIMNKHVECGFSISFLSGDYREIFKEAVPKLWRSEYHFAVRAFISELLNHEYESGRTSKIDFIFDEQTNESAAVEISWKRLKQGGASSRFRRRMGSITYGSDQHLRPLQAADMMAWLSRRMSADMLGDAGQLWPENAGEPLYDARILNMGNPKMVLEAIQAGDGTPADAHAMALRLSSKAWHAGRGLNIPMRNRFIDREQLEMHRNRLVAAGELVLKPDTPRLTRRQRKQLSQNQ